MMKKESDRVSRILYKASGGDVFYFFRLNGELYAGVRFKYGSTVKLNITCRDLPNDIDAAKELLETEYAIALMRSVK